MKLKKLKCGYCGAPVKTDKKIMIKHDKGCPLHEDNPTWRKTIVHLIPA